MSRLFFIQDEQGTHPLEGNVMPLSVGSTDEALIKIKGIPLDSVVAYIAEFDGYPYIQPSQSEHAVYHNHRRINDSAWLKSGDWVQIGETALNWQVSGEQTFIHVTPAHEQPMPRPQQPTPPVEQIVAAEPVLPINTEVVLTAWQRMIRRSAIGVLMALVFMALLLIFITPISIRFIPASAEFSVSGFPPAIPFAGRLMLLPGEYHVEAKKTGYRDFDQIFTVNSGEFQEYNFTMQELPGLLTLALSPDVSYKLYVDDAETALESDGRAELERGERKVRIETDRYLIHEKTIDVEGFGKSETLSLVLKPAWATVTIDSQPAGATVMLGQQVLGKTPLQADVVQGARVFELSLPMYKTVSVEKIVTAGEDISLERVKLIPEDGKLVVSSEPKGATITVNGQFYGTTPSTIVLASNKTHRLKLSKPGFKTAQKKISLKAEEKQRLTLNLAQQYGTVFVRSVPADAKLIVDGKVKGEATQRLRLSTQNHTLKIKKPGFTEQTFSITPRAGISQTLNITLKTIKQTSREATPLKIKTSSGQSLRLLRPTAPFKMGASRREAGRRANESRRLVQLKRPFYIGDKEVTNEQYNLFKRQHNSGTAEGALLNVRNHPVVKVSWEDAAQYCNWLSQKEGLPAAYELLKGKMQVVRPLNKGYRLPTEAEWVYVARIHEQSTPARYPWSGSYPPKTVIGNYADAQISDTLADVVPGYDDSYRGTSPVGKFASRPEGFYDLGGNVAEWTNDYYGVYPGKASKLVVDPQGPTTGEHHVVKDASWRHGNITELRLSYRDYSRVGRNDLGFRIARYAE